MATKKTGSLKGVDVVLVTSVNLAASDVTGVLPVANGGNGTGTFTDGQILIGNTTGNTLVKTTLTGTSNQVVVTNGAGAITLSLPQSIDTTSSPTFLGLSVTNDATIGGLSLGGNSVSQLTRVGSSAGGGGVSGTYVGFQAGLSVTGSGTTVIGAASASIMTGGTNTIVGASAAGSLTTGSGNVVVGYAASVPAASTTGSIVIGDNAVSLGSYTTVLGTNNTASFMAWGTPTFSDGSDSTKKVLLGLSGITTGTTRTLTVPDVSSTILVASNIGATVQAYDASTTLLGNTVTGTGSIVRDTSPTLVSPVLGVASATSLACPTFTSAAAMGFTPAAGSGFNVTLSGAGDVAVNTSQLYVDTSAGYVGIGTATPAQKLNIYKLSTGITTGEVNALSELDITMSAAGNTDITPFATTLRFRGSVNQTDATKGASGFLSSTFNYNTAIVTNLSGWRNDTRNLSTGTITNAQGIWLFDILNSGGGTITNAFGMRINDITTGTNNYGIGSAVSSGTNKFNIYASGTAPNYFAGNVGIGTTSPSARVHAISTTEQLRLGYDSSNYLSTTVSSAGLATLATTGTNASITLTPSGTGNVIMSKIPRFNGTNSTGAGSSLLGANSPATTLTAPYTWISVITSDGSTAYIPCWK